MSFHKDQPLESGKQRLRGLREIGKTLGCGDAGAAGHAGGVPVGEDSHAGGGAQARGCVKSAGLKRGAAEKESNRLPGAQRARGVTDPFARRQGPARPGSGATGISGLAPGEIRGHDQGRYSGRRSHGGRYRRGGRFAHGFGALQRTDPA